MAMNSTHLTIYISQHPDTDGILQRWTVQLKAQLRYQLGANIDQMLTWVLCSKIWYYIDSIVCVWGLYPQ